MMIDIKEIVRAKELIDPYIKKTPLIKSEFFSTLFNSEIYLKLENKQLTNSFKIRGAFNKLLNLTKEESIKGIITASSGNHAQAIAISAKELNISAKIIVPKTTPKIKLDKIKKFDVELVLHGENYDEAENEALLLAYSEGRTYVSAYNDKWIIAGQGTIGLEILDELPKVDEVLVPVGGGGLISGIAIAIKNSDKKKRITGIQTAACPAMYESLKAGKIVDVDMKESIADGMYGGIEKESMTFDIIKEFVDEIVVVEEETIKDALALLWRKEKLITEGSAAAAIAPLIETTEKFVGKKIVCIISGGNIEDDLFYEIIKTH